MAKAKTSALLFLRYIAEIAVAPRLVIDIVLALALFIGAFTLGAYYTKTQGGYGHFYQKHFGAGVMFALGKGYVNPRADKLPPMQEFLDGTRRILSPSDLPADISTGPLSVYQQKWLYLIGTVALFWRFFGLSWDVLWPLHGLFYGAVAAAVYALFRLCCVRPVAVLFSLLIVFSPINLYFSPHLRDYSKAPFMLTGLFILGYLVKHPLRARWTLASAALLGIIIGIGKGFRFDVYLLYPASMAVLLFLLPYSRPRDIIVRLCAVALLVAGYTASMWPIARITLPDTGSKSHQMITEGLAFGHALGLGQTPYDLIYYYNDSFAYATTVSFAERVVADPAEREAIAEYASAANSRAGIRFLTEVARTFPADMILRYNGAIRQVLNYGPFIDSSTRANLGVFSPWISDWMAARWRYFGWLSGRGILLAAICVLVLSGISLRYGAALAALILFVGLTVLQFDQRHYFHFEFVFWWLVALAIHLAARGGMALYRTWPAGPTSLRPLKARSLRRPAAWRMALVLLMGTVGIILPLAAARAWQTRTVGALYNTCLAQSLSPLPMLPEIHDRRCLYRIDFQDEQVDSKTAILPPITHYLAVDVDSDVLLPLTFRYTAPSRYEDFSCEYLLNPRSAGKSKTIRVFFAVYNDRKRGGRLFQGVEVCEKLANHIRSIYEIRDLSDFRLLLNLSLPVGDVSAAPRFARFSREAPSVYARMARARRQNLLRNGGFESWDGLATPSGFNPPTQSSVIGRESNQVAEGQAAVRQTWITRDNSGLATAEMALLLDNLEPWTNYELFARVKNPSSNWIALWVQPLAEDYTSAECGVPAELLSAPPAQHFFGTHSGVFTTGASGRALIATRCAGREFPAVAYWDDWRLLRLREP